MHAATLTATLISTVMALAPPTDLAPPDFDVQLESVELIDAGGDVQLIAYDASGEVIGVIALWVEDARTYLTFDYADGYADVVVVDGEAEIDATLPADEVQWRTNMMVARLDSEGVRGRPTALTCAATIAAATALCLPAIGAPIIITCPAGVAFAVCECAPVLDIELSVCEG
jgi:hypothetical protein